MRMTRSIYLTLVLFAATLLLVLSLAIAAPSSANAAGLDPWCDSNGIDDASCMRYLCGEMQQQQYCGASDLCPNLPGVVTVPAGYIVDASGNCVPEPPPVDVCANLAGAQAAAPPGTTIDASGNCVAPPPAAVDTPVVTTPVVTPTITTDTAEQPATEADMEPDVAAQTTPAVAAQETVAGAGDLPFTGGELAPWGVIGWAFVVLGLLAHGVGRRRARQRSRA